MKVLIHFIGFFLGIIVFIVTFKLSNMSQKSGSGLSTFLGILTWFTMVMYYNNKYAGKLIIPDAPTDSRSGIEAADTELHIAAKEGDIERLDKLISSGNDIEIRNQHAWTPLHSASFNSRLDIVRLLLEHKAKVNTRTDKGETPLHLALFGYEKQPETRHEEFFHIINLLLKNDCDINSKTVTGITPLHAVALLGLEDIVKFLLDKGADVNAIAEGQTTPLMFAAFKSHIPIMRLLIERNADVNCRNSDGQSLLNWGKKLRLYDVVRLLEINGAKK